MVGVISRESGGSGELHRLTSSNDIVADGLALIVKQRR